MNQCTRTLSSLRRSRSINLISRDSCAHILTLNNHAALDCNNVNDDAGSTYCRCFEIFSPRIEGRDYTECEENAVGFFVRFVFTARHSSSFHCRLNMRNAICSPEMLARTYTHSVASNIKRRCALARFFYIESTSTLDAEQLIQFLYQIFTIMKIEKLMQLL